MTKQSSILKEEIKSDSLTKIVTSEPIKDKIVINVPKSDNAEVNKMLDAILNQLNTSKSSGSNSYKSTYDAENQRLLIDFLIGQTQNKESRTSKSVTFEERTDNYIKKKITSLPWWLYLVAALYFLPILLDRVSIIINPIRKLIEKVVKR